MAISRKRDHQYYVYMMTNRTETLYTGVTSDLVSRVYKHKNGHGSKFTARYKIDPLVYFEATSEMYAAIEREK